MKKINYLLFVLIISISNVNAEFELGKSATEDFKDSFSLLTNGFKNQFQEKSNLYGLLVALPTLGYSFSEDKRISNLERSKKIPKHIQLSGDLAVALNFPVLPITTYVIAQKIEDKKLLNFSVEYFSTLYMALLESAALSLVPVHERPSKEKLSPWETNFRVKSSFPSGHVIPYAALTFKTFQFYGYKAALAPIALTYLASKQRVMDGKHYLSDVVGGIWLSYFASEGVRRANNFSGNNEIYQQYFESKVDGGIVSFNGVIGPKIIYRF